MIEIRMVRKHSPYLLVALLVLSVFLSGCLLSSVSKEDSIPWRFAVVSDTQGDNREVPGKSCINDLIVTAIAEDIAREKPDLLLVAGDLVNGWFRNGGTDYQMQYANWKAAMMPVYRAGIQIYPIRGNHDSGPERTVLPPLPTRLEPPPGSLALLKEAFQISFFEPYIPKNGPSEEQGLTYSFTHKNAFIVGLDQFGSHEHRINQAWLDRQLVENKKPHVFVFGHEAAFQVRHNDCLAFYPQDRDVFWDSIGKAGARLYFCGHDHLYNRSLIMDKAGNPIRQIISGTGGGRLRSWSGTYPEGDRVKGEYNNSDHHGYLLITIDGPRVTVVWKAFDVTEGVLNWKVLDSFSHTGSSHAIDRWK